MNYNIQQLELIKLVEDDRNARLHNKKNLEAIKNSLSEFEQYKPIIVQKSTMKIIAGNGTFQAARALGWKTISCLLLDVDDIKAQKIAIADNRTAELAEWDNQILSEILNEFDTEVNLQLGFSTDDISDILKMNSELENVVEPKEKKKKEKKDEDYSSQIVVSICGYPLVLADPDKAMEMDELFKKLKDQESNIKVQANDTIFEAIKEVLKQTLKE